MNAIISLCHFCELHGPSVVFCTQSFRDLPDFDALNNLDACDLLQYQCLQNKEQPKTGESPVWRYGKIELDNLKEPKSTNESCIACRSFPHNRPGFISNDDAARVSYISSQFPLQSELYNLVRQGCIRSLSCEVCPDKEGPIYFGDEARGHVLSYTFFLRDVQARGFQRWYSILILMKDKMLLLNSWPFLVRHLRETIQHLQHKASKVYENEESKVSHRALRSAASMADNSRKQRGQSAPGQPRALLELVSDDKVWENLHYSSTWLLKAGGLRLQEKLIEGPQLNQYVSEVSANEGLNIRELSSLISVPVFLRIIHHLLIGHHVIIRGAMEHLVSNLVQSFKPLLPKHCFKAVYFSEHYISHETCNVLGLHSLSVLPPNIFDYGNLCVVDFTSNESSIERNCSSKALIDAQSKLESETQDGKSDCNLNALSPVDITSFLNKCSIKIRDTPLPPRPPQVLSRIESAVGNSTLTLSALNLYISTVIYEWTNKVKVWVHVQNRKKSQTASPERTAPLSSHPNVIFRSASIPVLQIHSSPNRSLGISGSPPEITPQDERHQLLAALGCTEWDVPLLDFWAKNFNPT